jgi:hypothetical protein
MWTFVYLLRISLICAFRIFSRFRTAFDGRRSTQAWLQNLAPKFSSILLSFKTRHYINFGKFKLEKAPNFVTRPASNVDRRTPFGSEKKFGMHISVKCVVIKTMFLMLSLSVSRPGKLNSLLDRFGSRTRDLFLVQCSTMSPVLSSSPETEKFKIVKLHWYRRT